MSYRRYEATISDHRPVSAGFNITVKSIDQPKMAVVRGEVAAQWAKREAEMLDEMLKAHELLI